MAEQPQGSIGDRFYQQVTALQQEGDNLAKAALGTAQRGWMTGNPGDWAGDPFDIPGMGAAFDRDAVNQGYIDQLRDPANPGLQNACLSFKIQVDWLAVQERAFRLRHASSVRCAFHSAARRLGHGHAAGPVGAVLTYAQDLLRRG